MGIFGSVGAMGRALGLVALVAGAAGTRAPLVSSTYGPADGWDLLVPAAAMTPTPILTHFVVPIDVELRLAASLIPGAPRAYRAGIHEGIDLPAPHGTPVHAARAGTIIRVDREYIEWTASERVAALTAARRAGATPAGTLDRLRGRQVWIDHGAGVVTRYAHLAAVADLAVGDLVRAGQRIGAVGSSGLPEGGPHLHFEIRLGDGYLGEGLAEAQARDALARAFGALEAVD